MQHVTREELERLVAPFLKQNTKTLWFARLPDRVFVGVSPPTETRSGEQVPPAISATFDNFDGGIAHVLAFLNR